MACYVQRRVFVHSRVFESVKTPIYFTANDDLSIIGLTDSENVGSSCR